jgi:hypothetical protein
VQHGLERREAEALMGRQEQQSPGVTV